MVEQFITISEAGTLPAILLVYYEVFKLKFTVTSEVTSLKKRVDILETKLEKLA